MQANFAKSLAAVLKSEGGYVNLARDPGGATNKGITQATYDRWCDSVKRARQTVKFIHDDEVQAIYRREYWNAVHGDDLPAGLDYAVFDYAVNSGPIRAMRAYAANPTIDGICNQRLAFLQALPTWAYFGKGWGARVASVRALAKSMATNAPQIGKAPLAPRVAPQSPVQKPSIGLGGWLASIFKPKTQGVNFMISGSKTYMGVSAILTWIVGMVTNGQLPIMPAIGAGLAALTLAALRHGLSVGIVTIIDNIAAAFENNNDKVIATIANTVDAAVKQAMADYAVVQIALPKAA